MPGVVNLNMAAVIIVEKDFDLSKCLPDSAMPEFYMEDYSVMGLKTRSLPQALNIIENHRFIIVKHKSYYKIKIENAADVLHILNLLGQNNVDAEYTDLIDHVYQG